jgi:anti-sigma factor RsiW
MKTPDRTERITRWLDGAMSGAEKAAFQEEMQADPALRAEVSGLDEIGAGIRAHASVEKPVPNADFFNSQIQERISSLQRIDDRRKSPAGGAASRFTWLRAPWAIAGAAALLSLGLFIVLHEDRPQTQVVSLYVPNPAVTAAVDYNAAADATVLTLDGLSAFPDDKPISGLQVHHSDTDPEMASTTLYDAGGKVLLVMATDARNRPVLMGRGKIE